MDVGIACFPSFKGLQQVKCIVTYGHKDETNFKHKFNCNKVIKRTPSIQCHMNINVFNSWQSQCFYDVHIGRDNIIYARAIVVKLLLSGFDTPDGIPLSADMPYGQPKMNIKRPAVLRIYYGLNKNIISPTIWNRVTYGPTSVTGSLSIDPRRYTTKAMSVEMFQFGLCLKQYVKRQFQKQQRSSLIFDCELNHCTVLIYNTHSDNINCKLSYHCDCEYDHNGNFKDRNTQGENTPVIVFSMGDSRKINFRKRTIIQGKNYHNLWENVETPIHEVDLHDNSIFVLHPDDEKPIIRKVSENLSQFQHGNVKVKMGKLSIGLVYRNVTHSRNYDNVTSKIVLSSNYWAAKSRYITLFDETYSKDRTTMRNIETKFNSLSLGKLHTWDWI